MLATDAGVDILEGTKFAFDSDRDRLLGSQKSVRQVAVAADGRLAVAAGAGLFLKRADGGWSTVYPGDATRSSALRDVRGAAFDTRGRLWFASAQGAGCQGNDWKLYTGAEGLPYNDFTALADGAAFLLPYDLGLYYHYFTPSQKPGT